MCPVRWSLKNQRTAHAVPIADILRRVGISVCLVVTARAGKRIFLALAERTTAVTALTRIGRGIEPLTHSSLYPRPEGRGFTKVTVKYSMVVIYNAHHHIGGYSMHRKRMGFYSLLAAILLFTPLLAMAQIQIQLPPGWPPFFNEPRPAHPEHYTDEPRGFLEVINDWRDEVKVTVWSHQRERVGEWFLRPGEMDVFDQGGQRIKVRPHYKIKVGDDWGWVDVGQVGEFHNGIWYVRVRDVWRATHGARQRDRADVPDWRR
jgi:hypothetical protein